MNKAYLLLGLLLISASCLAAENWYNQALFGAGTSIKGFGATDQEVRTVDVVFRHARLFHEKNDGWLKGRHEFWMELPVAIIVHDSDSMDEHDFGIIGLNFLAAWIFPETAIGSPYFMIGGGPQYVLADIEGVGSDLCGNYQLGVGTKFMVKEKHEVNLEIRYHHISNLGMADPNVPLNSVKIYLGATLPF